MKMLISQTFTIAREVEIPDGMPAEEWAIGTFLSLSLLSREGAPLETLGDLGEMADSVETMFLDPGGYPAEELPDSTKMNINQPATSIVAKIPRSDRSNEGMSTTCYRLAVGPMTPHIDVVALDDPIECALPE